MWDDVLSSDEVLYNESLRADLGAFSWAEALLATIKPANELTKNDKPRLFELRLAGELAKRGLDIQYEFGAIEGGSTIDFRVTSEGLDWLIEAVSIGVSAAVKSATWQEGDVFGASLSSDAADQRQSEEGEILLCQQKLVEKVYRDGRPIKFPEPRTGTINAIVVDMRAFGLGGVDLWDCREIAYGHKGLNGMRYLAHWWKTRKLVRGSRSLGSSRKTIRSTERILSANGYTLSGSRSRRSIDLGLL